MIDSPVHHRRNFVLVMLVALLASCCIPAMARAQTHQPTVARTPPMGWNSWNYFAGKVTAADVRAAARAMVSSGMKAAGYEYVIVDDSWQGQRDASGHIHGNKRFPDMPALIAYVHSLGLKFGIYSSPGPKTCAGYPGSYGHVAQDAQTYAKWGVDYLKYDLCSFRSVMRKKAPNDQKKQAALMRAAYAKMGAALKATGRPIVYSLCQYGMDNVWTWGPKVGGNLWRTTDDIKPNWNRIYTIVEMQNGLAQYAGPGHWNDPDMLEVGNGKLSMAENRSHFTWWAMLAAPLIAGNDLAHMRPKVLGILTNRRVISVDQDSLGSQGRRIYSDGEIEVWRRKLSGGAVAIAVFNDNDRRSAPFTLNLAKLGLHGKQAAVELWSGRKRILSDQTRLHLPGHGVLMFRVADPQH